MSDPRSELRRLPMGGLQIRAIAICVLLNILDGFDVLAMAFTAAGVSAEWSLSGAELGVLLSAGLFGMTAGSLLIAPLGDRFGRRAVIVACLLVMTGGMLVSALTQSPIQLTVVRAITGLGIGGMLPSVNVITSEYSSDRWRSTAISLQGTGFPIGATLGGAIAAPLIASHGWRSAFVLGGVASLLLVPVVLAALPESMDYLVSKRPRDALRRLNRLLERMQRPSIDALPQLPPKQAGTQSAAYLRLFSGDLRRSSVLIALTFFLVMFCFYFVLSWTPKLLVAAGMSATQGITGGVLLNLGGIGGGLALGYLAAFSDLRRLTIATFLAGGVSLVLFGAFCDSLGAAFGVAVALGITLFGAMIGLYALTPTLYSPDVRATGMGWAVGMGRFGAIASPATVGLLIDAGWQGSELYYMFALPLLLAVGTVASIARR